MRARVSYRGHVHGFDDVAHVARGIPERFERLGFAEAVDGAAAQLDRAARRGRKCDGPFAERIPPKIAPEAGGAPRLTTIGRKEHLADARAAVERDSLEERFAPRR